MAWYRLSPNLFFACCRCFAEHFLELTSLGFILDQGSAVATDLFKWTVSKKESVFVPVCVFLSSPKPLAILPSESVVTFSMQIGSWLSVTIFARFLPPCCSSLTLSLYILQCSCAAFMTRTLNIEAPGSGKMTFFCKVYFYSWIRGRFH